MSNKMVFTSVCFILSTSNVIAGCLSNKPRAITVNEIEFVYSPSSKAIDHDNKLKLKKGSSLEVAFVAPDLNISVDSRTVVLKVKHKVSNTVLNQIQWETPEHTSCGVSKKKMAGTIDADSYDRFHAITNDSLPTFEGFHKCFETSEGQRLNTGDRKFRHHYRFGQKRFRPDGFGIAWNRTKQYVADVSKAARDSVDPGAPSVAATSNQQLKVKNFSYRKSVNGRSCVDFGNIELPPGTLSTEISAVDILDPVSSANTNHAEHRVLVTFN